MTTNGTAQTYEIGLRFHFPSCSLPILLHGSSLDLITDHHRSQLPGSSSCSLVLHYLVTYPWMSPCAPDVTAHWHHIVTPCQAMRHGQMYHEWRRSSDWLWLTLNGRKRWRKGSESPDHLLPAPRVERNTFPHIPPLTQPSHDWYLDQSIKDYCWSINNIIKHFRNLAKYPRSRGDTHNYLVVRINKFP